MGAGHDEERAVRDDRGTVDRIPKVDLRENFHHTAGFHHGEVTVFVAQYHFAIDHVGRPPDSSEHVIFPQQLACFDIQRVEEAAKVRDIEDAIVNRNGRDGAAEVVVPHYTGLGDVARPRAVDRPQMADAFAMFGVLANGNKDFVIVDDRRGDDIVAVAAALLPFGFLKVTVELPDQLAGLRRKAAEPAIAAGEDDLRLAKDFTVSRRGPLAV